MKKHRWFDVLRGFWFTAWFVYSLQVAQPLVTDQIKQEGLYLPETKQLYFRFLFLQTRKAPLGSCMQDT
jgi:hypothetical protein